MSSGCLELPPLLSTQRFKTPVVPEELVLIVEPSFREMLSRELRCSSDLLTVLMDLLELSGICLMTSRLQRIVTVTIPSAKFFHLRGNIMLAGNYCHLELDGLLHWRGIAALLHILLIQAQITSWGLGLAGDDGFKHRLLRMTRHQRIAEYKALCFHISRRGPARPLNCTLETAVSFQTRPPLAAGKLKSLKSSDRADTRAPCNILRGVPPFSKEILTRAETASSVGFVNLGSHLLHCLGPCKSS